jgi:hypothetical protein
LHIGASKHALFLICALTSVAGPALAKEDQEPSAKPAFEGFLARVREKAWRGKLDTAIASELQRWAGTGHPETFGLRHARKPSGCGSSYTARSVPRCPASLRVTDSSPEVRQRFRATLQANEDNVRARSLSWLEQVARQWAYVRAALPVASHLAGRRHVKAHESLLRDHRILELRIMALRETIATSRGRAAPPRDEQRIIGRTAMHMRTATRIASGFPLVGHVTSTRRPVAARSE